MTELLVELQPQARASVEAAIVELGGQVHRGDDTGLQAAVAGSGGHTIISVTVPQSVRAETVEKIDGIVGVFANPKIEPFGMLP